MWFNMALRFINADKVGGWVRAGVAAGMADLVMKVPALSDILTPDARQYMAIALATIAVGAWSHIAKSMSK